MGAEGDKSFQDDRASWYEAFTGNALRGDTLAQQNEQFDIIARRFRDYTDGRADIRERLRGESSDDDFAVFHLGQGRFV